MHYKIILSGLLASYFLASPVNAMEMEDENEPRTQPTIKQKVKEKKYQGYRTFVDYPLESIEDTKNLEKICLHEMHRGQHQFCFDWLFKVDEDPHFQIDTKNFRIIVKNYFYYLGYNGIFQQTDWDIFKRVYNRWKKQEPSCQEVGEGSDEFILGVIGEAIDLCSDIMKETIKDRQIFSKMTEMEREAGYRAPRLQQSVMGKVVIFLGTKEDPLKEPKYLLEQLASLTSPEGVRSFFITDWPKELEKYKTFKSTGEETFKKLELSREQLELIEKLLESSEEQQELSRAQLELIGEEQEVIEKLLEPSGDKSYLELKMPNHKRYLELKVLSHKNYLESKELLHKVLDGVFDRYFAIGQQAIEKCTREESLAIACRENDKAQALLCKLNSFGCRLMNAWIDSLSQKVDINKELSGLLKDLALLDSPVPNATVDKGVGS